MEADVIVLNHGTIVGFEPKSEAAKEWFNEHVASESWQWLGGPYLNVDHRMAGPLIDGLHEAGFELEEG